MQCLLSNIVKGVLHGLGGLLQDAFIVFYGKKNMAENNLKKLSRAELLEMMIAFSEEAEAAKLHEKEYKEQLEREKMQMQHEMTEERASLLKSFDEEKAQMRAKFNEQKAQMQAKFDKDITGLKARLAREKQEMQQKVDDAMSKIENSQSLAEASIQLGGIMEAGQKAADLYVETLKKNAQKEYNELMKEIEESRARIKEAEQKQLEDIALRAKEQKAAAVREKAVNTESLDMAKAVEEEVKPKRRTRRKKDE